MQATRWQLAVLHLPVGAYSSSGWQLLLFSCHRRPVPACLQVAYCTSAIAYEDGTKPVFEIPYDFAVVSVGEQPATFGVPGGAAPHACACKGTLLVTTCSARPLGVW